MIVSAVVAEVVAGPPDGPAPGTIVSCFSGWEQYAVVPVSSIFPVRVGSPFVHHLGLLGHTGWRLILEC